MLRLQRWWPSLSALLLILPAFAQKPIISPGGVVNAASLVAPPDPGHGIAGGSIVSLFGQNLASGTVSASTVPLPTNLNGTSVTVDGILAPLFYVSPTQVNFQLPSLISGVADGGPTAADGGYAHFPVIVQTIAGASEPVTLDVWRAGPGIFTLDGSGCGRGAVVNVKPDGSASLNSPQNSASPGDFLVTYATGLGSAGVPVGYPTPFPTTELPVSVYRVSQAGGVAIGDITSGATYAGRVPGLIGVDQVNAQIPDNVQEGCNLPFRIGSVLYSQPVPISIRRGGGACVDAPQQGLGKISLVRTVFMNSSQPETDLMTASFESSPGKRLPQPAQNPPLGSCQFNIGTQPAAPFCPIPDYLPLDVGTLTIDGDGFTPVQATTALSNGQLTYTAALPASAIQGGAVNVTSAGTGTMAPFETSIPVGPPIQITSQFPIGTRIVMTNPIPVDWTGGDSNEIVTLRIVQHRPLYDDYVRCTALGSDHNVSWRPIYLPGVDGGPPRPYSPFFGAFEMEIAIDVKPVTPETAFSAPGLTLGGTKTWSYHYRFTGLKLPD